MRPFHPAPRCVFIAVLVFASRSPAAPARTRVELVAHWPAGVAVTRAFWGVRRGGIELATGPVEDSGGTTTTIRATVPGSDATGLSAWMCINRDGLLSYVPSAGDIWQQVEIRPAGPGMRAEFAAIGWQTRSLNPDDVLTVHYHRFEQDYRHAGLWTWDERLARAPKDNELLPVGADGFGAVFQLDISLYGQRGDRIGLLPRLQGDWQYKDGPDRLWAPSMGREVYIVQGRPDVYRERPDVRPRLVAATLDGERRVTVRFTHRLPVTEWPPSRFGLAGRSGRIQLAAVEPVDAREGRAADFALAATTPIDLEGGPWTASAEGLGAIGVRPWRILYDPGRFGDPEARMGAAYSPAGTGFCVFAPTAERVWVVIAGRPEGEDGRREVPMRAKGRGIWEARVEGDLAGRYYAYRLEGPGLDARAEVGDIYATCAQNRAARTLIVNLSATDPPGFRGGSYAFRGAPTDAVIYEMHVRDFTIAGNSGARHKGRYLGVAEAGTSVPGGAAANTVATGLDHLVELGVTHVQLLPVQDFDNDEEQAAYSWGYMTVNFNTPEGWYASSPVGPARITELKQAIQALHERGIGVVLDVVYNHTSGRAGFERLAPGYYHRRTPAGELTNGSGCGNEFMSESPMGRKFILDSLEFWVREYQVDGFRFDLMGLIDLETMKQVRARLGRVRPGILVYGEPWTGGATPLDPVTDHRQVRGTGLGAFNDHFRDAIKGDRDGGLPGFVQVGDRVHGIRLGLEGAIHDWTSDPLQSINYFEAHDNLTAWDKMLQSMPGASDGQRRQSMRMASLILLTSQGSIFLHAGQEFCRTKQGQSNSYNLPDAVNQLDWSAKARNADVFDYVRGLIALRRAHPVLRLAGRAEIEARSCFLDAPDDRSLAWRIRGEGLAGEPASELLLLLNGGARPLGFALPAGSWRVHADADRAGPAAIREVREAVRLPAHSGMLLAR